MGPTEVNGLPAHALLVHVVVVLVPIAAILVALSAVWPAARRRLGIVPPAVALIALVSVPVTTHAGEWLQARVRPDALVSRHVELGDTLLPWVAALFLLAAGSWAIARFGGGRTTSDAGSADGSGSGSAAISPASRTALLAAIAVLSVVAAAGSVVQLYRIGDSGAKAVWHNGFTQNPRAAQG